MSVSSRLAAKSAFTLVELLAASALSALLLVGLLSVVTTVTDPSKDPTRNGAGHSYLQEASDLLCRDLAHAQQVQPGENRLELIGYGGLDAKSGEPMHTPVQITYSIQQLAGQSFLIRSERRIGDRTNKNVNNEIVCHGISHFALMPAEQAQPQQTLGVPPVPSVPLDLMNIPGARKPINAIRGAPPGLPRIKDGQPGQPVASSDLGPNARDVQEGTPLWVPRMYRLVMTSSAAPRELSGREDRPEVFESILVIQ